jgi:hypothetical protein
VKRWLVAIRVSAQAQLKIGARRFRAVTLAHVIATYGLAATFALPAHAQVLAQAPLDSADHSERADGASDILVFESGGLKYRAMTRTGVTVMFAFLPTHIREYIILQVAISNGASVSWTVKPDDFSFERADGGMVRALPAVTVVETLMQKGSRSDVVKLAAAYEASLFNNAQIHSTNGYEARRQDAFAAGGGSSKFKAAAAASAIAMVATRLNPGQSTDGAVFYPIQQGKPLGPGNIVVRTASERFVFPVE